MVASRSRPKGGGFTPFGLGVLTFLLTPAAIGPQDLADLIARQPAVVEQGRDHIIASPFGSLHPAVFSFPQMSAAMPASLGYALAGLDTSNADITGSIRERLLGDIEIDGPRGRMQVVDRSHKTARLDAMSDDADPSSTQMAARPNRGRKADRLDARPAPDLPQMAEQPPMPAVAEAVNDSAMLPDQTAPESAGSGPAADGPPVSYTLAHVNPSASTELPPVYSFDSLPAEPDAGMGVAAPSEPVAIGFAVAPDEADPAERMARLYFGADPMGHGAALERWADGQEPTLKEAADPVIAAADAEFRIAAPTPAAFTPSDQPMMVAPSDDAMGGQTIAPKGEVTGEGRHPMSPAERLHLDPRSRARTEKCLAEAIYFEARGEPVRGQMAVAQVVMNRVFSGHYPDTVCGVVYQNSQRHLRCQFTFTCDGIPDVIREPDAWERAKAIAAETLDGKLWLPEVGKATHYHAYWVHPGWVREMTKMYKLGVHTFYRPRKWGDGADRPQWGDAEATAEAARKL